MNLFFSSRAILLKTGVTLEPVIRMSSEHISVEILKFEFNLGSNWKMLCCSGQTHSQADF